MGYGASLAVIAVGAVLAFAVKWDIPGIDLQVIGWILIVVGAVGAALTALYTRRPKEDAVTAVDPDKLYLVESDPDAPPGSHRRPPHEETEVMPGRVVRREER